MCKENCMQLGRTVIHFWMTLWVYLHGRTAGLVRSGAWTETGKQDRPFFLWFRLREGVGMKKYLKWRWRGGGEGKRESQRGWFYPDHSIIERTRAAAWGPQAGQELRTPIPEEEIQGFSFNLWLDALTLENSQQSDSKRVWWQTYSPSPGSVSLLIPKGPAAEKYRNTES